MTDAPLILWFRRDLRLDDQPMLAAAADRAVIPVFVLDPETEALGAAAKWRLGLALETFAASLGRLGLRLILRRGPALAALAALLAETGAAGVHWSRFCDPPSRARDTAVKAALKARGLEAVSHPGFLLFEPWTVSTGAGGFYRVFTPFWRELAGREIAAPLPAPRRMRPPPVWPVSDRLTDWRLGAAMRRGAAVVAAHVGVGEAAARDRLDRFLAGPVDAYRGARDRMDAAATSRLSENLTWGEISPRTAWHAALAAEAAGARGAEAFRRQLVWREFAWHLMHHTPHIATANWRADWDSFPWRGDNVDAEAWRRGMTGEPLVDAAMREMYVTGTMHNRARMVVASYLTKHLLTDWRIGQRWFADCLTDWDPASNALGWQWVAGCGPDAAPYFRIFNPATQAATHDPEGRYRRRFVAELSPEPGSEALSYFDAVPGSWALGPARPYPAPRIGLAEGRARALAAYVARNS